jgi:hypothetical protein
MRTSRTKGLTLAALCEDSRHARLTMPNPAIHVVTRNGGYAPIAPQVVDAAIVTIAVTMPMTFMSGVGSVTS